MRDLDLVRHYWPVELRPAFDALFAIDAALAEIVKTSTQPSLGAIRLAWWREALERLDAAQPPAEPRLKAVADHLLPRGITGRSVASIEDGYASLLHDDINPDRVAGGGAALFRAGALLLQADDDKMIEAGRTYAVASAARRGLMAVPKDFDTSSLMGHRFDRNIRPLTALARLAMRDIRAAPDLEPEATPARAVALLFHSFSGR